MSVHSIHHVTAVTAQIAANKAFYTRDLGLRLVKRSVNQDDVSAYHLFYADTVGSPGTDMTFFDWPTIQPAVPGAATVSLTTLCVPDGSLEWWRDRLADYHPLLEAEEGRLLVTDAEGQRLELAESDELPMTSSPWTAVIPAEYAIRGIGGVEIESARPDATRRVMKQVLGYDEEDHETFWTSDAGHSSRVRVRAPLSGKMGRVGAGGVHHVAFRVSDEEELMEMMRRVESTGLQTSGQIDRFYFQSVYFREPGGVLFELATDGPGFASDEDAAHLGEALALPPFLEPRRAEIEAGLKPID